ncbi:MAG TPA: winged helix-turn-helix transcriptional regulator [Solirubrobacterales bacterium]|nr:winged helix-turn-helix transcriptional regulator [Solirubrobacterales bacterium]
MRAGAQTLTLLGVPRTFLILAALGEGPKGQTDLRGAAGTPAQSTLRGQLKQLEATGAILRRRRDAFPGAYEYSLTKAGDELLTVARHLGAWLAKGPEGPLEIGSEPARAAIKGLVDAWLARMLEPLAGDGPLSLTALDARLTTVTYPSIERRLETMRLAGQLEATERDGGGIPHSLTHWCRQGMGPLFAAAHWERRHRPEGAEPLTRLELETGCKVVAPLLALPPATAGDIQTALTRRARNARPPRFLGLLEIENGTLNFSQARSRRKPDAGASGGEDAWFAALLDGERGSLRMSGDTRLVERLLERAHESVFQTDGRRGARQGTAKTPSVSK